jgi:dTDP-4-dehydro-6-deoxy-alpha-D-glucopyranose 2,3-dehydratase
MSNYNDLNTELSFLRSALTVENPFNSNEEVLHWLKQRNKEVKVEIERISFSETRNWHFDEDKTRLQHASGSFFSIEGINIHTNWGQIPSWDQPIINQPEIGFLGIITKEFNGVL